ncbi:MAG: protein kinase [Candidatus Aminicenantales bacterium]
MKCPKCRVDFPEGSSFCLQCGTALKATGEISSFPTRTLEISVERLAAGDIFAGRFQVIEELGKGGMGRVYRAMDAKLNEEVALKLIQPDIASDRITVERFSNELKIARKIIHKNVGRIYELMEDKNTLFITMEYVPGEDLKSFIRRSGTLSLGKALFIAQQICRGLAEAHRQGIVHRDLKPQNIMIDKEGNAKIMDFGIARNIQAEGITEAGMVIGTPEYMSPEQVSGENVDPRSDIYSLGVILYEMLTGRVPFKGETSWSIALKQKTERPSDPRQINTQIPEDLSRLILRSLEKEREKRFQSAEDMRTALGRIGERIQAGDMETAGRRMTKKAGRRVLKPLVIPWLAVASLFVLLGFFLVRGILQKEDIGAGFGKIGRWKNSIAVLPFKPIGSQEDLEPICEGMTEAVIVKLGTISELKVVPYPTMRRYRKSDKSLKEIGKELDVETVLSSSLQKEGNNISIHAQLVKASKDFILWSRSYQEEFNSWFEVQDTISMIIADTLDVRFANETFEAITRREVSHPEAYKAYLRGRHFERKYFDTLDPENLNEAMKNYEKAVEISRDYALAYWGLGNVYQTHFVEGENIKDFRLMLHYYTKAHEADPDLAEANSGLGWASFYQENWNDAYFYYKRSLELDPNNPEIHFHVAAFLRDIGLYHQAIEYYRRALELDPVSTEYLKLCARCYMYAGEFERAASLLKEALEIEPNDVDLCLFYARQLIMMRKYGDAEKEIERAEALEPQNENISYIWALIYAVKGEKEKALAIVKDIDPIFYTHLLSSIYSLLGMKEEALRNIQEAIQNGFHKLKTYPYSYLILIKNQSYDNLRSDPRFKKMVKEEEAKYRQKKRTYGNL